MDALKEKEQRLQSLLERVAGLKMLKNEQKESNSSKAKRAKQAEEECQAFDETPVLDLECISQLLIIRTEEAASLKAEIERERRKLAGNSAQPSAAVQRERAPAEGTSSPQQQQVSIFFALGLKGPKFASQTSSTSVCTGCAKDYKNPWGLESHQRFCLSYKILFKSKLEAEEALRLARIADNAAIAAAQPVKQASRSEHALKEDVIEGAGPEDEDDARRGAAFRKRYTPMFKLRIIKMYDSLKKTVPNGAGSLLGSVTKLSKSLISKWVNDREEIQNQAHQAAGRKGRGFLSRILFAAPRGPPAMFPAAEEMVLGRLDKARSQRKAVSARILKVWMLASVKALYPNNVLARQFTAGQSWLTRFVRRHNLALRRGTNKKRAINCGPPA
jgi:hypothetical protein